MTPVLNNKKIHRFFSYVCNGKFAVFWVLCCGMTCKRVLFPTIDLGCMDRWKVYNKHVFACTVKTAIKVKRQCVLTSKTRHSCRASSFLTVFFVRVRRK